MNAKVLRYEQPPTKRHPSARSGYSVDCCVAATFARAWKARRATNVYDGDDLVGQVAKSPEQRWSWWADVERFDVSGTGLIGPDAA